MSGGEHGGLETGNVLGQFEKSMAGVFHGIKSSLKSIFDDDHIVYVKASTNAKVIIGAASDGGNSANSSENGNTGVAANEPDSEPQLVH